MAQNAFGQTQYGSNAIGGGGNAAADRERQRRQRVRRRQQQGGGSGGLAGGGAAAGGAAPAPAETFTEIPYVPGTMASHGGLFNPVTADNSYGNTGTNPLDTGVGSNAFNNPDYRNEAAWGLLNQAGISSDPRYANDASFIDDMVNNWTKEYEGLSLTENPGLTYENFLYGLAGDVPNTAVAPAGAAPAATPLGFEDWRAQNVQGRWGRMNHNARQRAHQQYNDYSTNFSANNATAPQGAPGTEAWRQQVYYPTMKQEIGRALSRATPSQRRREPGRWTGTGTTVAFG